MADLVPLPAEPLGESIVERLEEALERAREGKLSSVALALVYRSGEVSHSWSELPSRPLMLGAIARLAHKLQEDMSQ